MKHALIFTVVVLLAGASGYAVQQYLATDAYNAQTPTAKKADPIIGQPRTEFAMRDLDGEMRNISEWDGKIVLVNFWATWCPPCMREIPGFIELQQQYGEHGFQIIGVAVDDEDAVRAFADDMEINYPVMAGEVETIELARRYGNRIDGLPFSAFINRDGAISHAIAGELNKERIIGILGELGLTL